MQIEFTSDINNIHKSSHAAWIDITEIVISQNDFLKFNLKICHF